MRLSAAIPTRNRPDDLAAAVASILGQTRRPDEVIIIDQSPGPESQQLVEDAFAGVDSMRLVYIHDPTISGLVPAKKVAAGRFDADILLFLEDDVVLAPDYVDQIERGFASDPGMLGCCGTVTNLSFLPPLYSGFFHFFHRGIFADPRVGVHGAGEVLGCPLISSRALSGGLSAWRRQVFEAIDFDVENDFFMLEDIDFSTRAFEYFGPRFFINPNARLVHNMSPLNRARLGPRQRRKLREYIVFYKKRRHLSGALAALLWLLPGLFLEALSQSVSTRSASPLGGLVAGVVDGMRWTLKPASRR